MFSPSCCYLGGVSEGCQHRLLIWSVHDDNSPAISGIVLLLLADPSLITFSFCSDSSVSYGLLDTVANLLIKAKSGCSLDMQKSTLHFCYDVKKIFYRQARTPSVKTSKSTCKPDPAPGHGEKLDEILKIFWSLILPLYIKAMLSRKRQNRNTWGSRQLDWN